VLAIFIKYFKVINPGIFRTYVTSMIKAIKHNIGHSFPQFYIINSIGDNVQFSQHSGMILIKVSIVYIPYIFQKIKKLLAYSLSQLEN